MAGCVRQDRHGAAVQVTAINRSKSANFAINGSASTDLNLRPHSYRECALPTELWRISGRLSGLPAVAAASPVP